MSGSHSSRHPERQPFSPSKFLLLLRGSFLNRDRSPNSRPSRTMRTTPGAGRSTPSGPPDREPSSRPGSSFRFGSLPTSSLLAAGFEALDLLKIGVVVCDASAQVLTANSVAERILSDADGLELNSDGTLSATLVSNGSLRESIARVAGLKPEDPGGAHRALAVRRASGKRPLTLFLRAASERNPQAEQLQPAVLVLIQDSALPVETTEAELRQLYGLTAAEARISNLLMEGAGLEECCDQLGIRRTTARMHLRNIFAKTGVRRQSELVALLLRSIGLGPRLK
jgi:DNA-binding CsgD family transcriptional regulator